jgi:serine/threonine protein kinase/tetratricopeptide (TPR) repeat protein
MSAVPKQIGPYKIIGKLGQGGMGIVYSADDTRLNRPVALKMILDSGSDEDSRKRFLREAQAAARVTHPNICRLYDIGEVDGCPFLVMELLEGESMSVRLGRGPMPLAEALPVALSVLSALAALHRSSIVHRDLKPSNVFLSTQGVKVLDFGLAKPVSSRSADDEQTQTELTGHGVIAGTPRYLSPEQVTGKPVDARSDLFATAVILFEALAGKPAFTGNSAVEIFHSVLYETPPLLSGSQAISAVDRIVRRAMDKNPANRFDAADDMAAELRSVLRLDKSGTRVEVHAVKRLIVLPFRVLRSDPETDFLAFSLPDAIAASLAGLNSLVVRSSLAAARFAGLALDLKEIAKEVDVDTVLTGTLLRAGTHLRLATQLVEAPSGTLIWSKASQVELCDIFQLQDTLVSGVVESLALPLTAGERQQLTHDAPASPTAYDLYLRANEAAKKFSGLSEAIGLYEQCVALDPAYAPAWARLGRARWLVGKFSEEAAENLVEGRGAIERALALNPDLPLAHNLYTNIQVDQGQANDAMKRLLKRLHSSKSDPELFSGLAHASRYCGLLQASIEADRQARRFDPNIHTTVTHTYFAMGDYQRAVETGGVDFGYFGPLRLAMLGRVDEAIALLNEKERGVSERIGRVFIVSLRALLEGNREASLKLSDELMAFPDPEGIYYLARQLAYLSEVGRATRLLKRAVDGGYFCFPQIASDPWLDPIRGDAEFKRILHRAQALHQEAIEAFSAEGGPTLLGQGTPRSPGSEDAV